MHYPGHLYPAVWQTNPTWLELDGKKAKQIIKNHQLIDLLFINQDILQYTCFNTFWISKKKNKKNVTSIWHNEVNFFPFFPAFWCSCFFSFTPESCFFAYPNLERKHVSSFKCRHKGGKCERKNHVSRFLFVAAELDLCFLPKSVYSDCKMVSLDTTAFLALFIFFSFLLITVITLQASNWKERLTKKEREDSCGWDQQLCTSPRGGRIKDRRQHNK